MHLNKIERGVRNTLPNEKIMQKKSVRRNIRLMFIITVLMLILQICLNLIMSH